MMTSSPSIPTVSRGGVTVRQGSDKVLLVIGLSALLIACGDDEKATPTTTSEAPATTLLVATTTEPAGLSREAREAVLRCQATLNDYLPLQAPLGMDDYTEAVDLCNEAALQLEVDDTQGELAGLVGQVVNELDAMGDIAEQDYDEQLASGDRIEELARTLDAALSDA